MTKRKQEKMAKRNDHGSILIGIVLFFILVSLIILAVINRSRHGAQLAVDSRSGYSAYQASDSNVEKILNNIRKLDKEDDGQIPENTSASLVCDGVCYKSDKTSLAEKVSGIVFVKKEGEAQNLERAIFAPLSDRIVNPLENIQVLPGTLNRCDARLILDYSANMNGANISKLEVRKSANSSLSSGEWKKTLSNFEIDYGAGAISIKNIDFKYGMPYYFSLKAKNKNPFQLDSLYYAKPNLPFFRAPSSSSCSGGFGETALGCSLNKPENSRQSNSPYACCGGTECYVCNVGWKADVDALGLKCCTQIYKPKTNTECPCGVRTVGKENKCQGATWDICRSC